MARATTRPTPATFTLADARAALRADAQPRLAEAKQVFFKTSPGGYGAGDVFLGVTVPPIRALSKKCIGLSLPDVLELLQSRFHEERLLALCVLALQYAKGNTSLRRQIYDAYLSHSAHVNNWDLVDASAHLIIGPHVAAARDIAPLVALAGSGNLWERRIAIVATLHSIRQNDPVPTLRLAKRLLHDPHDLIHKAVGWMLREVGKRDARALSGFLDAHHREMPRTMLRYAIERLRPAERRRYMAR